jgi:hypothetical protein
MARFVISWFGYDLQHLELVPEERLDDWLDAVESLCERRYWRIERLGNPIDLIFGAPYRSIAPRDFFDFQRDWDALNEEYDFKFSGVFSLMDDDDPKKLNVLCEWYVRGRVRSGDSIGRPSRHRVPLKDSRRG